MMGFRGKLIISYIGVIFLTVAMAVGLFYFSLQQIQQDQRAKADARLRNLTSEFGAYIKQPNRGIDTLPEYRTQAEIYSNLLDVRILSIDQNNLVRVDTADKEKSLTDQRLNNYTFLTQRTDRTYPGYIELNGTTYRYYALVGIDIREASSGNIFETDFVVATPEKNLAFSLSDVLSFTIAAVVVVLIAAILVALIVARTITNRITRMTLASEAIAKGDYNQRLQLGDNSNDEINRLADSFNRMTVEVARSHQAMRDFVANVSHELKTPLTSIQGYSQAIIDGVTDTKEEVNHSAEIINDEAARMRRLVDTLLDLSRIEAGQAEMRWTEISVTQLVERVIIRITPLAVQKNVSIKEDFYGFISQINSREHVKERETGKFPLVPTADSGSTNPALPTVLSPSRDHSPIVWGDSDRLEQVITNVMDNAIKYSPEGGTVTVSISLSNNPPNNPHRFYWVAIAISNNGPLIPLESQDRIFERFYKMDKSRVKKKGESTGLGLAIAKELIEAHRGVITVESGMVNVVKAQDYPYSTETQEALTTFNIKLPLLALPVAHTPELVAEKS
jgi:signal transduction histidine kinase